MAGKEWRLVDTGPRSAAENMALDDAILELRSKGLIPNTVRFLQFKPHCVLVGYHQVVEHEVRVDFCTKANIQINRRLTGGGAIYFDESSLGWEIIASKEWLGSFNIEKVYRILCEGVIAGLSALGIEASFRPKNDVEVNGRKICGTGGTERDDAFLFQGTLLIDFNVETMVRALRIPVKKLKDKEIASVRDRVTCLRRELGFLPRLDEVKRALKSGIESSFAIELVEGKLTQEEENLLSERLPFFRSNEWIYAEKSPLNEAGEVCALEKTPGGLIRVFLAVDRRMKIIKSALITGDFFSHPPGLIREIEARLKFAPINEESIRKAVFESFEISQAQVPNLRPESFVKVILEATQRTELDEIGISPEEANFIYTVGCGIKEALKGSYDTILVPYCAKLVTCDFRRKEGCAKCGKCSVGAIYEIGEQMGLKVLTIQNYEHLNETLREIATQGSKGWIGCCCEAFYCKHADELERIGIPAILIDIENETCYDLGRSREAYEGEFQSQTKLRVDLVRKIVEGLVKKNERF